VKFFFDNCVSQNLVEALRCLENRHDLVHLPAWIGALGAEGGWIIISGDPRISRGKAERAAWVESGLTAFFCGDAWQNRRLMTQASELLRMWDDMVERAKKAPQGSGYLLEFRAAEPRQIYPEKRSRKKSR